MLVRIALLLAGFSGCSGSEGAATDSDSAAGADAGADADSDTDADADADADTDADTEDPPCTGVTCSSPPDNKCGADGELEIFNSIGWCEADGSCAYASWLEVCGKGICEEGVCTSAACAGKICDEPPDKMCMDENTVVSFNPIGYCISPQGYGQCRYASFNIDCPGSCADNACADDICAGAFCAKPPARYCDGDVAHWFNDLGWCAGDGACVYAEYEQLCDKGCELGFCTPRGLCDLGPCLFPPASYCSDDTQLVTFAAPGYCEAGVCRYQKSLVACAQNCVEGKCQDDPCAGVSCAVPPATHCKNADTLLHWNGQKGVCEGGTCNFKMSEVPCLEGCEDGQCKNDPCAGTVCMMPPPASCAGDTLSSYALPGKCDSETGCQYARQETTCALGCEAGACEEDTDQTLYAISGKVYDDVDYGGGPGRTGNPTSMGRAGAVVELYKVEGTSASYVEAVFSGGGGAYVFPGQHHGSYAVRVVSSTVSSSRPGYSSALLPVLTARSEWSDEAAKLVTDFVGGTGPNAADGAEASVGVSFDTATGIFADGFPGMAQVYSLVTIGTNAPTGVDFFFNFDTVTNTNDSGAGSLRQVLTNATALGNDTALAVAGRTAGIEHVVFMIPNGTTGAGGSLSLGGGGLRPSLNAFVGGAATIGPTTPLPQIDGPLLLDGRTQPGWTKNPIVEIQGSDMVSTGLSLGPNADGSTVGGLVLNRFIWTHVSIGDGSENIRIQGNWIGLDKTGTTGVGSFAGIELNSGDTPGLRIGGPTPDARNVISGNQIAIFGEGGTHTDFVIEGNWLGVAADGVTPLPNTLSQIKIEFDFTWTGRIGGTAPGAANLINASGSAEAALQIPSSLEGATTIAISRNAIFGAPTLAIDLGADGRTLNDGVKTAGQANEFVDYPVFTVATLAGNALELSGYVGSAPSQGAFGNCAVEVFQSSTSAAGAGQGQVYLGTLDADDAGNFSGSIDVTGLGLSAGDFITGTATDGIGNTSEFADNFAVSN